ncbi:MAG TPA: TraR/DksA family transcriptional regulator [Terriglobia bacterium]|nr:TraR/DksA family transcriptional regulator [Terriglobia bacterium]
MKNIATQPANEAYRRKLLERRREVLSGLNSRFDTLASMGNVAEDDRAEISHREFLSLQRNRMDYNQLRLVDEALDRIESGDYGICLECEEPIAPKRLQVVSWARYCVKCQEKMSLEAALD